MTHGVFYQMPDGSLNDINPAGLRLLGLTEEEFLGEPPSILTGRCWTRKGKCLTPENYPVGPCPENRA
jgi:PAS domain-containing protein